MNNDFDIDDILNRDDLFQPLTEGLGFHHSLKDKDQLPMSLKKKSLDLQKDLRKRAVELSRKESLASNQVDMGELSPFYDSNKNDLTSPVELSLNGHYENSFSETSLVKRFLAYFVDLTVVVTLLSVSLFLSLAPLDLGFNDLFFVDSISILIFSLMSAFFYMLYFSFFDKSEYSTIGKRVIGLKLISLRGELKLSQVLTRSLLSLVSLLSLGMLSILKIENQVTETIVIENE